MSKVNSVPNSGNGTSHKAHKLQYLVIQILTITTFVVLFRMATRVIPSYGAMYEGLGDTIPRFMSLFLNNFMLSLAVVALFFAAYLFQHISFAHSFHAARISIFITFTFSLLLLTFFWIVCKYPMWRLQHIMKSVSS